VSEQGVEGRVYAQLQKNFFIVVDRNGAFCCIFTHCLIPPDLTVTYNEPKTTTKINQMSCIYISPIKLHVLGS